MSHLRNVRVVAVDAHHIPYYGKKVKAKKGFSSSKGRALPGYKVYVVTDIGSNLTLAYEVAPAVARHGIHPPEGLKTPRNSPTPCVKKFTHPSRQIIHPPLQEPRNAQ